MRATLQLALDALNDSFDDVNNSRAEQLHGAGYERYDRRIKYYDEQLVRHESAITAIKQALSEPESEPVAYSAGNTLHWYEGKGVSGALLYLHPPEPSRRDTGKAYEHGRRDMLDEVLKLAPDSISVLLERLKEKE